MSVVRRRWQYLWITYAHTFPHQPISITAIMAYFVCAKIWTASVISRWCRLTRCHTNLSDDGPNIDDVKCCPSTSISHRRWQDLWVICTRTSPQRFSVRDILHIVIFHQVLHRRLIYPIQSSEPNNLTITFHFSLSLSNSSTSHISAISDNSSPVAPLPPPRKT